MERCEKAVEYKHNGYNCCAAVLMAYADKTGMDELTVRRTGVTFGSGMGSFDATCGALIGAQIVLGWLRFEGKPMHAMARELLESFNEACGATICRELKGIDTGKVICSCDDCVRNAVKCLDEFLSKNI